MIWYQIFQIFIMMVYFTILKNWNNSNNPNNSNKCNNSGNQGLRLAPNQFVVKPYIMCPDNVTLVKTLCSTNIWFITQIQRLTSFWRKETKCRKHSGNPLPSKCNTAAEKASGLEKGHYQVRVKSQRAKDTSSPSSRCSAK